MISRISDYMQTANPDRPTPQTPSAALPRRLKRNLEGTKNWIEGCIEKHPEASIGAIFCLGVMIGWFAKRK
jgi:hypothetical protein